MHQEQSRSTVTCWKGWWEPERWHRRRLWDVLLALGRVHRSSRQCTNCCNDIINGHRLELTERRSGRIRWKRWRRGVGCCGSYASNFIIEETMKLRRVIVSRQMRFTAIQQCINWPPQLARLRFLCFDLGLLYTCGAWSTTQLWLPASLGCWTTFPTVWLRAWIVDIHRQSRDQTGVDEWWQSLLV